MKRARAALQSERGFTLLEVVISVLLLTLVFSFFDVMTQTLRFTNRGRFDDIGRSIGIEHLEIYRAMDFNLLPSGTVAISDPELASLPNGTGSAVFSDYGSADSGIVQVEVTINWLDKGVPRDVALTSLLTNGGVGK